MCILGGGTERPYFCYINPRNYRVQNHCVNYWHHVLYVIEGPTISCDSYLKERFLSLIVCLHILFISLFSAFLFFFSSYFFCYPHFAIRIFPSASAIRRYPVRYPVCVLQTPHYIQVSESFPLTDGLTDQPQGNTKG